MFSCGTNVTADGPDALHCTKLHCKQCKVLTPRRRLGPGFGERANNPQLGGHVERFAFKPM